MSFARDLGRQYLATLCQTPELEGKSEIPAVPCPDREALTEKIWTFIAGALRLPEGAGSARSDQRVAR